MAAETVDSVAQLEEQSRRLTGQIDHLTQTIDGRQTSARTEISTLSFDKFLARLGLSIRDQSRMFEMLADRARVTRTILLQRSEGQEPPPNDFQHLQDQVVSADAEMEVLRFAARHGIFPEDLLHEREKDHRKLLVHYREVAGKKIAAIQQPPASRSERRDGKPRVGATAPGVNGFSPDARPPGLSAEGNGSAAEVGQTAVRQTGKEGVKTVYELILPGEVKLIFSGRNVARCLEVLLPSLEYLTMKQIADKALGSTKDSATSAVSTALSSIEDLLASPDSKYTLDSRKLKPNGAARPPTAFLVIANESHQPVAALVQPAAVKTEVLDAGDAPFKPGVKPLGKEGRNFIYEVTLPGGNTIKIQGVTVAKCFEVLLGVERHLTQKEIARIGWGSDKPGFISTVSPALSDIRDILRSTNSGHELDEKRVPSEGPRTGISIAFLIKDRLNRQPTVRGPSAGKVAADGSAVGLQSDPAKVEAAAPTTTTPGEETAAVIPDGFSPANLDGVKDTKDEIRPSVRVIGTEGLALGALVVPAPVTARAEQIEQENPPLPDIFTKLKAPVTSVPYRGPGAELPGYLALRVLATQRVSPTELLRIASGEGLNPVQAVDGIIRQLSDILFRERAGPRLEIEKQGFLYFIKAGFEGLTNDQILAAYRRILTESFANVEPLQAAGQISLDAPEASSILPIQPIVLATETPIVSPPVLPVEPTVLVRVPTPPAIVPPSPVRAPVPPARPVLAMGTTVVTSTTKLMPGIGPDGRPKLVPVPPGRLGLRAWAQNPGISPEVLFGIISAQGTIKKTLAIEGVVGQLAEIVAKQATGRLSPDETAILRYARDYIPVSNDKISETCRVLLTSLLKGIEAYTPTNGTNQNGSVEFHELTEVLEAQVIQFAGKLRGKDTDGYVTMKVARNANGKYGPQRLRELQDESRIRTVGDGNGNDLYSVSDLVRVHFGEKVTPEILGQVLEIAEQELARQS